MIICHNNKKVHENIEYSGTEGSDIGPKCFVKMDAYGLTHLDYFRINLTLELRYNWLRIITQ
jgi:hypothetical protein